jgi:hypothetical protein
MTEVLSLYTPYPGDWRSPGPDDWGGGGWIFMSSGQFVFPLLLVPHTPDSGLIIPILF